MLLLDIATSALRRRCPHQSLVEHPKAAYTALSPLSEGQTRMGSAQLIGTGTCGRFRCTPPWSHVSVRGNAGGVLPSEFGRGCELHRIVVFVFA